MQSNTLHWQLASVTDPLGRATSYARLGLPVATTVTVNAANEAVSVNGGVVSYDGAGEPISDGTRSFTWNDRNQLTGVGGGAAQGYGYDPLGRRDSVTSSGVTTGFVWDATGNQVAELSGSTVSATELTAPVVDQTLVRTDAGGGRSLVSDRLGSTVATVDSAGTVRTQDTYTPFGGLTSTGDANAAAPSFTGRVQDTVNALQYNRGRFYSTLLGRFISQDPTGQAGGTNVYAYAGDDPVNATDPSGDAALLALGLLVMAAPEFLPIAADVLGDGAAADLAGDLGAQLTGDMGAAADAAAAATSADAAADTAGRT